MNMKNMKNMSVEPECLYRERKLRYRENTASKLSQIRPTSKSKCSIAGSSLVHFVLFCSFLAFCLATHSCFRGGPEGLCSGITLNVQSKSE